MAFYHDQKKEKREKESKGEVKIKAQIPLSPVKCRIVEM